MIELILMQRVDKLGQMGEVVRVKDGFGRNYLLPRGKALRSTNANKKRFEDQRIQLEARNLERKSEASAIAEKLDGISLEVIYEHGVMTEAITRGVLPRCRRDAGGRWVQHCPFPG